MPSTIEYMQFATGVYAASGKNTIGDPVGWKLNAWQPDTASGFSAGYYFNSQSNEVVISYTGTNDWIDKVNWTTGAGLPLPQILNAVSYYFRAKAAHPDANITFTGHSLGGGLASMMAVFFDKQATVFDEAPFQLAAMSPFVLPFIGAEMLLAGYQDAAFSTYLLSGGFLALTRESNVTQYYVEGEVLNAIRFSANTLVGSNNPLLMGNSTAGAVDRHSMALMTALWDSPAFLTAAQRLPDLVTELLDTNLFATDSTDPDNADLLRRLLRHQLGIAGVAQPIQPDDMLNRFAADMNKIAQDNGLTLTNSFVTRALTAFAMQMYYEDTDNAKNANKTLFTDVNGGGGIQFDMADVAKAFKDSFDAGKALNLDDAKGGVSIRNYIYTYFTTEEQVLINTLLPTLRDWYIQAGATGMTATDTLNRNAFLLGGKDSDGLVGGSGTDLLIGNAGADLLQGKGGNDILLGGAGNDTYVYTTGDGLDTILDVEGQNTLAVDGDILTGGAQYGDALVHRSSDGKHLYVQADANTLLIDGNLIIQNYTTGGSFNLTLTGAAANENPQTTADITGDIKPDDTNAGQTGIQAVRDAQGRLVGTAQPYEDILVGTAANEHILSGELDDNIGGRGGNDWIEAGAGSDYVNGEDGNDLIEGGQGRDILAGDANDDAIYGNVKIATADAIAHGRTDTASDNEGDWLAGNAGDDILVAGADNDVLTGGAGQDLLIAGAGDDFILGDADYTPQYILESSSRYNEGGIDWYHTSTAPFDWSVTPQGGTFLFAPVTGLVNPEGGGADVIYAGKGKDYAWGGVGNDVAFGEEGDDYLMGEAGNDILLGGVGSDYLYGDGDSATQPIAGNDYLDGGEGNDNIYGMAGDDILIGGKGDDTLYGGQGRDTYIISADGKDRIVDADTDSVIMFGDSVSAAQIKLRTGSLLLDFGNGAELHIENFDYLDPLASASVASFQFADGTSLSWEGLLARGFDLDGTDGNDTILGTGVDDRIDGKGGDDIIAGLDGNDTLIGGAGMDNMLGGLGNDTYVFNAGDGTIVPNGSGLQVDGLFDEGGDDTVRFNASVDPAHLNITDGGNGALRIDYQVFGQPIDRLVIADGQARSIEHFRITTADGTKQTLDYEAFIGRHATGSFRGTDAAGVRHVAGGNSDDLLMVAEDGAVVSAGQGNDTVHLTAQNATLNVYRGDGADLLSALGANATLRFVDQTVGEIILDRDGNDVVLTTTAGDEITVAGWLADDGMNAGLQTVQFVDAAWTGDDIRARLIAGTAGDDHLVGYGSGDAISAGDGNDTIEGRGGNDQLDGGAGDDLLIGGAGADVLSGGAGTDIYAFATGSGADTVIDGGSETNILRFESWQAATDLRAVRDGTDLKLLVKGTADSVALKDYYAGSPQSWSVDFDGANAVSMEAILAQPDESATAIGSLWADTKAQVIAAQTWTEVNYCGWTNLGNMVFQAPGSVQPVANVSHQETTTNYLTLTGHLISSDVEVTHSEQLSPGSVNLSATRDHYLVDRIDSNDALISNSYIARTEVTSGTAVATLAWQSTQYNYQHSTWNTSGFMLDQFGNAISAVQRYYDLTSYSRHGSVQGYSEGTSGWTAPLNVLVGNRVAVSYTRIDSYSQLVAEIVAGDGNNEIHASSGATEFVDGGLGNDTIYGSFGAMGRSDVLFGNGGDDLIYGEGAVMAGGDGNDQLYGGAGWDRYLVLSADEDGVDLIEDRGSNRDGFEDWYYQQQGIADYRQYEQRPAMWDLWYGDGPDFFSLQEAEEYFALNYPDWLVGEALASGDLMYISPTEALESPLLGDSKDFRLIGNIGLVPQDVVELPAGIVRADLSFGWGSTKDASGKLRATLEVAWYGATHLSIVMPRADDPIGYGIEFIKLADGDIVWMSQAIDLAPPMPDMGDGSLLGNGQANTLIAAEGGSHLFGMSGDDTLLGGSGSDFMDGGYGSDLMAGGAGNDVYVFRFNDGHDLITDDDATSGNIDTVLFTGGIGVNDVLVLQSGNDLVFKINLNGSDDRLTVSRWFAGDTHKVEQVRFLDGTTWNVDYLIAQTATILSSGDDFYNGTVGSEYIEALAGDDYIYAWNGNDVIRGGDGNDFMAGGADDDVLQGDLGDDYLMGGTGNDVYLFSRGGGHDLVSQDEFMNSAGPTDIDVVRFDMGINPGDVVVTLGEGSLNLTVTETGDILTLEGWRYSSNNVAYIQFQDGTSWDAATLASRVTGIIGTSDADYLAGMEGDDLISGLEGSDYLGGNEGNDILRGGAGDDEIVGGSGNDVYLFGRGDGHDLIYADDEDGHAPENMDVIRFGDDVAPEDVDVIFGPDDLVLSIADTGDSIAIESWQFSWGVGISQIEFGGGTVWDEEALLDMSMEVIGTDDDDELYGTRRGNLMMGFAGNDYLDGMDGDDALAGGNGDDILIGGAGDDVVTGGVGNDVYEFARGDGNDLIMQDDYADGSATGDIDVIRFAPGITQADVRITPGVDDLVLTIIDTGDTLTLQNWRIPSGARVSRIEFHDGMVWDEASLAALTVQISGTEESDYLAGTSAADILHGLAGNDEIDAGGGADTLIGGRGDDTLSGGTGNDVYFFNRGDGADRVYQGNAAQGDLDVVRFGDGIAEADVTVVRSGTDLLLLVGDAGDSVRLADWLNEDASLVRVARVEFAPSAGSGQAGTAWDTAALALAAAAAPILGDDGRYYFAGTEADDLIQGFGGSDTLDGLDGNDTLIGGRGDDILTGGTGNDVYVFDRGDGADQIYNYYESSGDTVVILLGTGIAAADVRFALSGGQFVLSVIDSDDSITIDASLESLPQVQFADGTVWDRPTLLALVTNTLGADGDDFLIGTAGNDSITGGIGYDMLYGLSGDDILSGGEDGDGLLGGAGNDTLVGGAGSDFYVFNRGDGQDVVDQSGAAQEDGDVVYFGNGIAPEDVVFSGVGTSNDLLLQLAGTTDSLILRDWFAGEGAPVSAIYFADGTAWDQDALRSKAWVNHAPVGEVTLTGIATRNETLTAANTLTDADGLGSIGYQWECSTDGSAWNAIDGATAEDFTLTEAQVGQQVRVIASYTDAHGTAESIASVATVSIANINNAPTLISAIGDRSATQDIAFSYAVPNATFADSDPGDTLTFTATLANGAPLPVWLNFNAATRTFSGTPDVGSPGVVALRVTATDSGGLSAQSDFSLSVGQHLHGTGSSDTLNYSASSFVGVTLIDGGAGNDAITGSAGNDIIVGGSGTDNLIGGDGDDIFLMSGTDAGYDRFEGGAGYDVLQGSAGDDAFRIYNFSATATVERIDGNGGNDIIAGTGSSDTLDFSATELIGIAMIDGGAGNDAITGSAGNDLIVGGSGTDNLIGGDGDDTFLVSGTDAGYDRFEGGAGYDVLQGSAGNDTFRMYNFSSTATVERIDGNGGNDIIAGTGSSDTLDFSAAELVGIAMIDGGAGNDAITGSAGNDLIVGGSGTDNLIGGDGDDTFLLSGTDAGYDRFEGGAGFDVLQGSAGDDTFRMYNFSATATVERIDGNGGNDIIAGTGSSDTLDFSATELIGIAMIDGGAGNDAITGSAGNDLIVGGSGTDNLIGGDGDDIFLMSGADAGYDRFEGGLGFDLIQGSAGDDTFRMYNFSATATVERIDGNGGNDIIAGTGSSDTLNFLGTELAGIALIDGGAGNDVIVGSAANDVIVGGTGSDNLIGGDGDDTFLMSGTDAGYDRFDGGAGYDVIRGSTGDDVIRMYNFRLAATVEKIDGGGGNDILAGTGSSDTLDFSATELVGIALIDGGAGNDAVMGSAGNDTIVGGSGTDNLIGNAGDDTFLISGTDVAYDRFEGGDGYDVIQGSAGDDVIRMYNYSGTATVEKIDGGGGNDILAGTGSSDTLDFSGTELVGIAMIDGGAGNDAITGSAGNDIIVGGKGTDNLRGGQGNDTYRMGLGDGADTLVENDATAGNTDVAEFLAGIQADQIWLRHLGNNLEASIIGTADKLTVQNWYLGEQYHIEQFRTADGTLLLDSQVENLVQAMAAFAPPGAGQTTLPPIYQDSLAPVIAANWQ